VRLGTDGWRGVIAEDCTYAAIRRIAAAAARVHARSTRGNAQMAAIGHDTRFASPELARVAAEEYARVGVEPLLTDRPIPTPAISWYLRHLGLAGGAAVTASHNPAIWNGFKLKAFFGGSAPPEYYEEVAREMEAGDLGGRPSEIPPRMTPIAEVYAGNLARSVDLAAIRGVGLRVLADSMHGAAARLLSEIVGSGKSRVEPFRANRDPLFGGVHPEPIAANLSATMDRLRGGGFDLAVAHDGDADRLGVLDARGDYVSAHKILGLLLLHAFRRRGLSGGIAKTFSTSLLIDRIAGALGAPLVETGIGFKFVAERMDSGEVVAGGEESGGFAFGFYLPERDGVFNALLLLESLALSGRSLSEALAEMDAEFGRFAYGRRDVYLPVPVIRDFLSRVETEPPSAIGREKIAEVRRLDGVKYLFGPRGWLLHRLSGTEPMIRLYCEHQDPDKVEGILNEAERRLREFAG
jgi:phosphomannomutase